ncbi:unnamed protein product [Nezara viridula]|uniref:Uncharacterized protein n=1 Tax=Nezara viridula TaxID=85310 RepID=A0A9P0MVF2_NEZVI|nr:unnamed protein product [Nezara viridula]
MVVNIQTLFTDIYNAESRNVLREGKSHWRNRERKRAGDAPLLWIRLCTDIQ